ncbi:hypothetical protein [Tenacibaculum soleae]|uniref:hypothetical protein n=1 Tax=Tenacibaculum soleae TaxID=447689 RepID=UPI0026E1F999|nr:hypothetical protein [Tenacibaculum soleae]MDO6813831.1 hypothetical protein [Tenacibaculum soleae]
MIENILQLSGVLAPVLFGFYKYATDRKDKKQKDEITALKQDKTASGFNIGLLSNLMKMKLYSSLEVVTKVLFKNTKATRVIVFVAINGKVEPKKVYALFGEKDDGTQIDQEFKGVEIDEPYLHTLHELEKEGSLLVETMKLRSGLLKNIYFKEQITFSYLKFVKRYHLTEEDDAVVYMSIATDNDVSFNSIELTEIDIKVSTTYRSIINKIAN